METLTDVAINPDPYLQKGDLVAAGLFFESIVMAAIAAFLAFQVNHVPRRYRNHLVLSTIIVFCAAIAAFYRRDYWIETSTNPVEFKFFDWFVTVPLMATLFYLLARPAGAKVGFLLRTLFAVVVMLLFGYLGEAVYPEQAVLVGSIATLALVGIISSIMLDGYRKVKAHSPDPAVRQGYLWLGLSLPLSWLAYPFCYLSVPGNLMEGFISPETTLIVYSFANVLSKGGLVMGVYFISIFSLEGRGLAVDAPMRQSVAEGVTEAQLREKNATYKVGKPSPAMVRSQQMPPSNLSSPWS